jgi:NADH:ubiquinone reductase (non-electrogenic)
MWPKGKKPKITLIDKNDRFVFKPLLYELVNGTAQSWEVAPTFAQLLAPYPIQFLQDKVSEVSPESTLQDGGSASGGTVRLASGAQVEYDWLVVSLGAAADPRGVPGVREYARPFITVEDAEFVAQRLAEFEARAALGQPAATVVVVGAGYAGVELSAVVAERVRGKARVLLVTPSAEILDTAPAGQREAATQALRSLGVSIMTGNRVTAVQQAAVYRTVDPQDPVSTAAAASGAGLPNNNQTITGSNGSGVGSYSNIQGASTEPSLVVQLEPMSAYSSSPDTQIEADLVLWTAGSRAASQPLQPFPCDSRGQLKTDPTLRVVQHARVFALGDVSKGHSEQHTGDGSTSTSYYPATAQVAFQQADYAAWNIWAAINGRPLLPFRYQHLGDMMSLGSANAAVALPIQLPTELTSSIASSPLGNLLTLAGLKLGDAGQQQGGVTLEGPLAQLVRRAAYLYRQPTNEQRINVAASWLQQASDAAQRLLAESANRRAGADSRR